MFGHDLKIVGQWRGVLEYFDAHVVGLTATPGKQTFGFFKQNLVSEYTYPQSVADNVNVDFDIYRIKTQISEQGSTIDAGTVVRQLTAEQRARGLMERPELPDRTGMLFDFGETRMVTMWMANTPASLDMIFIDESGRIVRIAERTTPLSESIVSSGEPIRYALEIRGGHAKELGLDTTARLILPLGLPQ